MKAVFETENIIQEYLTFIANKDFACIAAKAALARQQIKCFVADNMACPKDDYDILKFLYSFIEDYRQSNELYHSATVIFKEPAVDNDEMFDVLMWQRLQALADMDCKKYNYDPAVASDPHSPNFSFSLKEESFFIIALHAASSRLLRRFKYATLVFNPHRQFEELRASGKYEMMKEVVRKRDIAVSGSINPMLKDFGEASEVYQYSGRKYHSNWECPLKINHGTIENNCPT
ncbi:MAG: guanitoxin biosynthesis heme-dependent pre-guanitoxin N-hydroxylase GntA [Ginsengibacter sp.]